MIPLLAVLIALQTPAAPTFDPEARIQEAIAAVRPYAYRADLVDWSAIEQDMRRRAHGVRDTVDLLPTYAALTWGLGDNHSFVRPPDALLTEWMVRRGGRYLPDTPRDRAATSTFQTRTEVENHAVPLETGRSVEVVVVPAFNGGGPEGEAYAGRIFSAVADAGPTTCGYVLDLRGNTGGNIWPMVAGLSGLLGNGPVGRGMDRAGVVSTYAELKDGSAISLASEEREVMTAAPGWRDLPALRAAPVALIIDDAVASSGEGVAIEFVGRPSTRVFGARTYGVASANESFELSDGVRLYVTVAMMVDRNGRTYPEGIDPDEVTPTEGEAPVAAARAWLALQPACAA